MLRAASTGATGLKIYARVDADTVTPLVAHVIDEFYAFRREQKTLDNALLAAAFEMDRYKDLFATLVRKRVMLDATLVMFKPGPKPRANDEKLYDLGLQLARAAHQAGVIISAGTDAFSDLDRGEPPMIHAEMALLVEKVGMKPIEALRAATWHNELVLGMERRFGSLDAGMEANLLGLNGNPAANIGQTRNIAHIIKNGRFIDTAISMDSK